MIVVEDADSGHTDSLSQTVFAFAQCLFRQFAVGDVECGAAQTGRLAMIIVGKLAAAGDPVDTPVWPDDPELFGKGNLAGNNAFHFGPVVGMNSIRESVVGFAEFPGLITEQSLA